MSKLFYIDPNLLSEFLSKLTYFIGFNVSLISSAFSGLIFYMTIVVIIGALLAGEGIIGILTGGFEALFAAIPDTIIGTYVIVSILFGITTIVFLSSMYWFGCLFAGAYAFGKYILLIEYDGIISFMLRVLIGFMQSWKYLLFGE